MDERHFPIEAMGNEVVSIGQGCPTLFYYRGEQFDNEEDFLEHVRNYNAAAVTKHTIKEIMEHMIKETLLNNEIVPSAKCNGELQEYISQMTIDLILWLRND